MLTYDLRLTQLSWETTYKDGRPDTQGGLFLLARTPDIVLAVYSGYPVVVGFKDARSGHTGLLTKITARPGGTLDKKRNSLTLGAQTWINSVEYLDPQLGESPIVVDGDEFLKSLAFAFAIKP